MNWPWSKSKIEEAYARGANDIVRALIDNQLLSTTTKEPDRPVHWDMPWQFAMQTSPQRRPHSLVDVRTLRMVADNCDHVRAAINHLKREVIAVKGEFVGVDEDDESATVKEAIADAQAFFAPCGGLGEFGKRQSLFESEVLEDVLVLGCTAVWCERTRGGELHAVIPIDATTIRPVRDVEGWTDPARAFEQFIQGVVTTSFSTDELIFDGIHSVTNTPYYKSPIEWIFSPITAAMSSDAWNREWLVSGNAPGDDVFTLPKELKTQEIKTYVEIYDQILSANTRERRKVRFLPDGSQRLSIGNRRDMEFQAFELWLLRRICAIFGVTAASIGYAGEQYKISQEKSVDQTSQFGAGQLLEFRSSLYNEILRRMGLSEVICWRDPDSKPEDPGSRATRLQLASGGPYKTVNEVRAEEGLDPVPGGDELRMAPVADKDDEGDDVEVEGPKKKLDE